MISYALFFGAALLLSWVNIEKMRLKEKSYLKLICMLMAQMNNSSLLIFSWILTDLDFSDINGEIGAAAADEVK